VTRYEHTQIGRVRRAPVLAIAPFEKACFGAMSKPGRRGNRYPTVLFGQFAKPAQSNGGLRIVGFVPAVERTDFYPLKSGTFN
jgi:hypothetical protein